MDKMSDDMKGCFGGAMIVWLIGVIAVVGFWGIVIVILTGLLKMMGVL